MTLLLAFFLTLVTACQAAAQPLLTPQTLLGPTSADSLFDDSVLHDITLTVSSADWQTLKDHYLEDTYYPAEFRWRTNVIRGVGIKSRGSGSRSGTKPGLKVDFSRYATNQTFLGLKSLVLRNNTQDPSGMRERISMRLYQRLGIPASREAHARLFINGEYSGLYTVVEPLDKAFLRRVLGDDSGWLYSYDYPADAAPFYFDDRGADPAAYVPVPFAPETQSSNPRGDIIASWVMDINRSSDAAFRSLMAGYIDLQRLLSFAAVDAYLGDDDGILGNWGMNNFYTYRFPGTSTFVLFPWDKSDAFAGGPYASVWHNIRDVPPAAQNRLVSRSLRYADLYAWWLAALADIVRITTEVDPSHPEAGGWLTREIAFEYAQVREAALADPVKPFSNAQFEQDVDALRAFASSRGAFVMAEVAAARSDAGLNRRVPVR